LCFRGELWIAVLGKRGRRHRRIGATVVAALRAFDVQYLAGLRPAVRRGAKSVRGVDRTPKPGVPSAALTSI